MRAWSICFSVHANWNITKSRIWFFRSAYFDIAIVEVTQTIPFSEKIYPICIPEVATDNYEHLIGFGTVISGYGPTNLGQNKLSLTRASVVVRHPDYCAWKYKHISPNDADFNEVQRVSMTYS